MPSATDTTVREHVRESFEFLAGSLHRDASLALEGYFAALIEWGV
jgi:hypothetical protein